MKPNRTDIEAGTPRQYPISGWIEAGLYVFAIAFLSLAYVVGHRLGAHPIVALDEGRARALATFDRIKR